MNIGEAIKEMRTDRRLSQKELAEKATISQNSLCNIEKGYSFPSKDTIKAICDAMDIPVSWLLFSSITEWSSPIHRYVMQWISQCLGCSSRQSRNGVHRYTAEFTFTIERICSDLESVGYSVQPVLIPACAVGAPHRRDRVFIIAHNVADTTDNGNMRDTRAKEAKEAKEWVSQRNDIQRTDESDYVRPTHGVHAADTEELQRNGSSIGHRGASEREALSELGDCDCKDATDTDSNRRREIHEHIQSEFSEWEEFISNGWLRYATDTGGEGLARENESRSGQEREWMRIRRDLAGYYRKTALRPQEKWTAFPTVSAVHRRNDGIPFDVDSLTILFGKWRTESLKAYGNAIVPQVMYRIFEAIEAAEKI